MGPATLVGSAAFDLFPIHAVCVVVPKAGELKKISDIGVWLVELFWSFWAYIWLYIILEVIQSNFIHFMSHHDFFLPSSHNHVVQYVSSDENSHLAPKFFDLQLSGSNICSHVFWPMAICAYAVP